MLPLHWRGRSVRPHEKLGEEGNRHNEQPVNTQFRISEKLAKNWEKPLFRARKKKPPYVIKMLTEKRL